MTTTKNPPPEPVRFEENRGPFLIAGLSESYAFGSPMDPAAQWTQFASLSETIPHRKENVIYGVCLDLENGKGLEYLCGVEVSGTEGLPESFTYKTLPVQNYAVFAHIGHVSTIFQTCDAIWKEWIPESGFEKPEDAGFFFERYGEKFDPQKGMGDIEIWLPISKGEGIATSVL